jgi:CubicO group peptidase (beta-lactamase class C family)
MIKTTTTVFASFALVLVFSLAPVHGQGLTLIDVGSQGVLGALSGGQAAATAGPTSTVTLTANQIADRVDPLVRAYNTGRQPGMSVGVVLGNSLVFKRGYGYARLDTGVRNTPESVFDLASSSKQFTGMCIQLLVEQKKLNLSDPIGRHLGLVFPRGKMPTVGQLLHHTSGLPDYLGPVGDAAGVSNQTVYNHFQRMRPIKPDFDPGQKYDYSNSGYVLLAEVVRSASGKSLKEYADEHIFRPLGMTHTVFWDSSDIGLSPWAKGYKRGNFGGWNEDICYSTVVGDGGLQSTVEDLAKWMSNFYSNRLGTGGSKLMDAFLTTGRSRTDGALTYASGIRVGRHLGRKLAWHGGSYRGYRAMLSNYLEDRVGIIILGNRGDLDTSDLSDKIAAALFR